MRTIRTLGPKTIFTVVALGLTAPVLAACEDEGPMEQLGENLDEAGEDTADAMEDAADEMEDRVDAAQ